MDQLEFELYFEKKKYKKREKPLKVLELFGGGCFYVLSTKVKFI